MIFSINVLGFHVIKSPHPHKKLLSFDKNCVPHQILPGSLVAPSTTRTLFPVLAPPLGTSRHSRRG